MQCMGFGKQQQQQVEDALRQFDLGSSMQNASTAQVDQQIADLQIPGIAGPWRMYERYQAGLQRLATPAGICMGRVMSGRPWCRFALHALAQLRYATGLEDKRLSDFITEVMARSFNH